MLARIVDRYLRIDARSLGLFRIGVALALIADLLHRWDWIDAFYSNEGVLPNHNHLFQHRESGGVWSLHHSFSSVDENHFFFVVNLLVYLFFLFGWHTRVFHVLSLVCLVSLTGRNVLLESHGNSVAVALLGMTALLPLGARFSIDSVRRSLAARDEKTPEELDDRSAPSASRPRASLAALGALLVLGGMLLFAGLMQSGQTWSEGTALHYALHVDRWTGAAGVWVRETLPPGLLSAWTRFLRFTELGLLPLLLVPAARRYVRGAAMALLSVYALTFGVLFTYGLYGWTLLAAAALVIPEESWETLKKKKRPVSVWYDDDCGICLWAARLLKRLDFHENVRFFATSDVDSYPKGVTEETTARSMVVVGPDGTARTDALALSEILRSLPILWPFGWLVRAPGARQLCDRLYRKVADNRVDISIAFGLGACGVASEPPEEEASVDDAKPSPGRRLWEGGKSAFANLAAAVLLLAFVAQSERLNPLPFETGLGNSETLAAVATWPRMMATWDVWAPDPPRENAALVVDAETRNGWVVDVLTGYEPDLELTHPRLARKGVLWAAYTDRIRKPAYDGYRREFQRYLSRGGYALDTKQAGNYLAHFGVFWVSVETPPPGKPRTAEVKSEHIMGQRGRMPDDNPSPLRRLPRVQKLR